MTGAVANISSRSFVLLPEASHKLRTLANFALTMGAVALFAGCGASQPSVGIPLPVAPAALHQGSAAGAYGDRQRSWALSEAKSEELIYVADGEIEMFSFPSAKLVGSISDTGSPKGVCSDKSGDVFVVEPSYARIAEYKHASSKPAAVLKVESEPFYCAVDPGTGDLAVTVGGNPHPGVAIFAHAKGKPKYYRYGPLTVMWYCTYDNHGNLFVDGEKNNEFGLVELASGSHSFKRVQLSGSYNGQDIGAVQWDGKYVTIGNQVRSTLVINRLVIREGSGKVVGSTVLRGIASMSETWFKSGIVLGATPEDTILWDYPAGGQRSVTLKKTSSSTGVTVSVAPNS